MPSQLPVAAVAVIAALALAGCGLTSRAPLVTARSCPALVTPIAKSEVRRPAPPADTLLALRHWRVDMEAYADALELQSAAREEQIDRHNAGL